MERDPLPLYQAIELDVAMGKSLSAIRASHFHEAEINEIDSIYWNLYHGGLPTMNTPQNPTEQTLNQRDFNHQLDARDLPPGKVLAGTPDVRTVLHNYLTRCEQDSSAALWLLGQLNNTFNTKEPLPPGIERLCQAIINYMVNSRY